MGQSQAEFDGFDPTGRRAWSAVGNVLVLAAVVVLVGGAACCSCPSVGPASDHRPQLLMDDSVAVDFEVLAQETWHRFLTEFRARSDCFGDVHLHATRVLDSRAGYDPHSATVTVRVPGTPAMLQSALIHEWAHHVEFQCAEHEDLRPAFLAAQGLPPDTPWRPDDAPANASADSWAGIPSEQYAEAAVELVLGGRPIPTKVRLTREAVRAIREWAAGE